jgi:hypothetical protein
VDPDGAQRSSTGAAKPGLAVAGMSPAVDDVLVESPVQLVVGFTGTRLDGSTQLPSGSRLPADPDGEPCRDRRRSIERFESERAGRRPRAAGCPAATLLVSNDAIMGLSAKYCPAATTGINSMTR